jgi:hypothetical protein
MLIVSTDRVCSIAYILQNPETRYNFDTLFAKKSNIYELFTFHNKSMVTRATTTDFSCCGIYLLYLLCCQYSSDVKIYRLLYLQHVLLD